MKEMLEEIPEVIRYRLTALAKGKIERVSKVGSFRCFYWLASLVSFFLSLALEEKIKKKGRGTALYGIESLRFRNEADY